MPLRRPLTAALVALPIALAALVGCSGGSDDDSGGQDAGNAADAQASNPYAGHALYADPGSKAAQAAADAQGGGEDERARLFTRLAETPQGIWLTPEEYPAGSIGPFVTKVVDAADDADAVPTFVVYGVPDRDCSGGHSAGGLSADEYGPWVGEIADAASEGDDVVAIVEPDALASLLECGDRAQRVALIKDAATRLADAGVTTYIDGGHSHWVEPVDLAPLLREAGVEQVRGFATNVSNFQTDDDEQRYAERLSARLGGAHFVVDTGRNGFGSTDEWCNPPGRAFGSDPGAVTGDGDLDAYLWVKPPGESDGECHGGPPAGQFWPERAQEMATASGW